MRLFLAIQPEEEIKDALMAFSHQCRGQLGNANWTRRDQLHITLEFLGELPGHEKVLEVMSQVSVPHFSLRFAQMGYFGDARDAALWLGVTSQPGLMRLQRELHAALLQRGFRLEGRPYRPHLTLARRVDLSRGDLPQVPALSALPVHGFSLMESRRVQGRLYYLERGWRRLEEQL